MAERMRGAAEAQMSFPAEERTGEAVGSDAAHAAAGGTGAEGAAADAGRETETAGQGGAPAAPLYRHVAFIGLGLIASSLGQAMKALGLAGRITGHARSQKTRVEAREVGFVDEVFSTPEEAVAGADLVILATPVRAMGEIARRIGPHLSEGATVSDVGSVKRFVVEAVRPHLFAGVHFIPAHPIAGTEHSGPKAGFPELFHGRWCIFTPLEGTDPAALARYRRLWEAVGSKVDEMDPDHHDLVLAVTSHAPHLIAYTMVGVADDLGRVTDSEVIQYSAAGFRDFTRIAASDPTMWRDVFLTNKDATLEILGRFTEELFALQRAIRMGDGDFLHTYFTRTRAIRRGILEAGQDVPLPDFGRAVLPRVIAAETGTGQVEEAGANPPETAEGEARGRNDAAAGLETGASGSGEETAPEGRGGRS